MVEEQGQRTRRRNSQGFFNDGPGVGHLIQQLQRDGRVDVRAANGILLLANLAEYLWVIGQVLKNESDARRHGILGSEKEGHELLGHRHGW